MDMGLYYPQYMVSMLSTKIPMTFFTKIEKKKNLEIQKTLSSPSNLDIEEQN